ncbi:hypothetical protein [Mesorhizobium sp. CN2-181]|uniref:hypothetical protein n=1 Tax=Mesorhizobium yinganensis TaxID=3157707 RepID=UPI0032B77518
MDAYVNSGKSVGKGRAFWGVGRLPSLVADDLSERFFSQHRRTSQALRSGDPAASLEQIARMMNAWRRLNLEAERRGASTISPAAIEANLSEGTVIRIVCDRDEACAVEVEHDGREVRIYMASEIARLIEQMPTVLEIKRIWPGAKIKPTKFETPDYFWDQGDEIP